METHHRHHLLLITAALLLLTLPKTTTSARSPDDPAIVKLCAESYKPNLCVFVLESDPNRDDSDYRNLSLISNNFTRNHVSDVLKYARFLANKFKGTEFQPSLDRCVSLFGDAVAASTTASDALLAGRFREAVDLIYQARGHVTWCETLFEPQPSPMSTDVEMVRDLCENTVWIIYKIKF
ncbi:hypothetical protein QJS10_CPB18g00565 [Acorus calamus]|uniref:Pectinesterase inhibitor domain-containing protein n=1 Tax=Acorus calamus TaxID=4465 RepID=A0AAV9CQF2_ACOCL|nr:hypothetical protein QJS10_CPB18g00565 [Acorus calamus]